jgi:hypothetical protein
LKTVPTLRKSKMKSYRSSKWFILLTVGMAVFTDIYLYALIVPVMPYALTSRTHIKEEDGKYHAHMHSSNRGFRFNKVISAGMGIDSHRGVWRRSCYRLS